MFSASLELILSIAYREAESRRHADLTLEHLLYALAHDVEAEKIMQACGADLPALRHDLDNYLQRETDRLPRHSEILNLLLRCGKCARYWRDIRTSVRKICLLVGAVMRRRFGRVFDFHSAACSPALDTLVCAVRCQRCELWEVDIAARDDRDNLSATGTSGKRSRHGAGRSALCDHSRTFCN